MDKEKRINSFVEDYGKLTEKYKVDYVTFPQFIPDGQGGFKIICQTQPIDLEELKKQKDGFIKKA